VQQLERECRAYTRYLCGQDASPYLIEKYLDFHQKLGHELKADSFDSFLVRMSARGGLWVGLSDSYARILRKNTVLRKKLIVVLALLECTPPSFEKLDSVPTGGIVGTVLRLAGTSARFVLTSALAVIIFFPARLWMTSREH
jgi:hypothetical protein